MQRDEPVPAKKQKKNPKPKKLPTRRSARIRLSVDGPDCPPSEPTSPMSCDLTPVAPVPEIAGHSNLRENSLPPESAAKKNELNEPSAQSPESVTEDESDDAEPVPDKVPARRSSICETASNGLVPDTSTNESTLKTNRSITPNSPVPLEDMISPTTANEIRCTIRALFPNGPPKLPPIIPVKRHKKGDTPYIVGCTKRKRVPESKSLKFFKGDDYGITSKTNALDDQDAPLHAPAKRSRITYKEKISKSRFNSDSDEIAARLKLNDTLDDILRDSSQNGTTLFMSNQYPTRLSEFSPMPSTSKDYEIIQKNEKQFTECLNDNKDNDETSDDEDLPEVILTTKHKQKNKKRKRKVQNENLDPVTVTTPTVINEILSQINSETYLKEIDFHAIFSMKKSPNIVIEDENTSKGELQSDTAMEQDDIIEIKDNTMSQNEISEIKDNTMKQNGTIEIKDNTITQNEISEIKDNAMKLNGTIEIEDNTLNDLPKEEEIVDFDEILAEYEAYKKERDHVKLNSANIINIVDPITLEATKSEIFTKTNSYQPTTHRNAVDLVTQRAALNDDKGDEICEVVLSTSTTNNNKEALATPLPAANRTKSNMDEEWKSFPSTSSKKDNPVDLVQPQSISNKRKRKNEIAKKNTSTSTTIVDIVDLENYQYVPSTSPPVIEIPDVKKSPASVGPSTQRYWWSDDVEIVSETLPDRQVNTFSNNDVEIVEERREDRSLLMTGLNRFFTAVHSTIWPVLGAPHLTINEPANPPKSQAINVECSEVPTAIHPRSQAMNEKGLNVPTANHPRSQKMNENPPEVPTVSPSWSEETGDGLGECPICLERLVKTSVASTTCGHVFCLRCLKQALKGRRAKRCPTCRKILRGPGYTQLYL